MELHIPTHVYNKIMYWVNKTDIEVSGFGKVIVEGQTATVLDAYLIKQEGGAAHTEIDEQALARLMYEQRETPGVLRFWWHSHVNMDVFWSGQDRETINTLGNQGWCVATVFNKKYQMRTAMCFNAETALGPQLIFNDEIKTTIVLNNNDVEAWDAEFDANVTEQKITYTSEALGKQWDGYEKESLLELRDVEDETYYRLHGLIGYGIEAEAAILRMNPKKYLSKLMKNSYKDMTDYINTLELAERNGKFGKQIPYNQ